MTNVVRGERMPDNGVYEGANAAVTTANLGTDTTNVFDLSGAGYNGGLSSGNDVGYDFAANGNIAQFMANDILSFNWEVPVSTTANPNAYSQIFQVVINAQGAGYNIVGGSNVTTGSLETANSVNNQGSPYAGELNTFSFNYDSLKAALPANPTYLQLGISTNNGNGVPGETYFHNFTLSSTSATPEPASLGLLAVAGLGVLRRRRTA